MWIEPIYNRTQSDVEEIKDNPLSSNTKGAFNCSDLNRIEANTKYLCSVFEQLYKFNPNLVTKTNWIKNEIPKLSEINRIRKNIVYLQLNIDLGEDYREIEFTQYMDYEKANILEKNLELIKNKYEEFLESGIPTTSNNVLNGGLNMPLTK